MGSQPFEGEEGVYFQASHLVHKLLATRETTQESVASLGPTLLFF